MNIVIQCAARKNPKAGKMQQRDGREVSFVGRPDEAPQDGIRVYAHPDDITDSGTTWRDELLAYNSNPDDNPYNLVPAYDLYGHKIYRALKKEYGSGRLYILSAGWGLIASDFLVPHYDITFSSASERYKRRGKQDASRYRDFHMLDCANKDPVVFFGGKDYVDLFCELSQCVKGERSVFYRAKGISAPGCSLIPFETRTRTNWHYECASAFMNGRLQL